VKFVIHLWNLKFHPLDKSFLFLHNEMSSLKLLFYLWKNHFLLQLKISSLKLLFFLWEDRFHYYNMKCQVWKYYFTSRKILFYCNLKFQFWNYYFKCGKIIFITATWNFNSEFIILSVEKSFSLLQPEISILKLLF
jgi:hypothetical protein